MTTLDVRCILGEAGDILVNETIYQTHFNNLASEVAEGYRRLIRLPAAIDVIYLRGMILMVNMSGDLMLVDNNHPEGVIIEMDLPPLQKIYNSRPFMFLDRDHTLHLIDLSKYIMEVIPEFNVNLFKHYSIKSNHQISFPQIRQVEWMIAYNDQGGVVERVIVKVPDGLISSYPVALSIGNYKIERGQYQLIGNCYSYREGGIRYTDSGDESIQIDDNTRDVIYSGGVFYILDDEDTLILSGLTMLGETSPDQRRKLSDFKPTRLLNSTERQEAYVEDSGGNIYDAYQLIEEGSQIESINLPVIIHGFI